MTIEDAIKILGEIFELGHEDWRNPDYDAIKLGIEALKFIKEWRIPPAGGATILLLGETDP